MVVDGHAVVHRAFHAVRQELTTSRGELTNAVFGFAAILLKALQTEHPEYCAVCFDRAAPTFRHERFTDYKAHRPPMPEPLAQQFKRVREVVAAFNFPIYEVDGFEADDVIGTLARQAAAQGVDTLIVTGDLDATQLVTPHVTVLTPRRGADDISLYDEEAVRERYGLRPDQIPDYKGLVGDKSDNIPGVPGVGEKTAVRLLQQYNTVEGVYEHLAELPEKQRARLEPARAQALESKHLATIVTDVPVTLDLERSRIGGYDRATVVRLFGELEFRTLLSRLPDADGAPTSSTTHTTVTHGITPAPARPEPTPVVPPPLDGLFAGLDADAPAAMATPAASMHLAVETRGGRTIAVPVVPPPAAEEDEGGAVDPSLTPPVPPTQAYVIDTEATFAELLERLARRRAFALDLETDALDPISAGIVGISVATEPGIAYYIPVGHDAGTQLPRDEVLERLRPLLGDPTVFKVAHNGKFDLMVLAQHGVEVRGLAFDTMIAAYLINPSGRGLGLKDLALTHFNVEMTGITELIGKGKDQITMAGVDIHRAADYAAADADLTLRLRDILEPQLREAGLFDLFRDVEMPLVSVLAGMELAGMDIDTDYLHTMSGQLRKTMDGLALRIYEAIGHPFNINSPKQLSTVLFEELKLPATKRTSTGYSTDAEVLENLRGKNPVVDQILEYRQLAKLKGTYLDGLPALVSPKDGRIHTDFNQTVASTGRLSSSNPNLQNIPIRTDLGRQIRRAFIVTGEDELMLAADYSQIELRILAHLSHDPILVDSFTHDRDIHVRTAALIYGIPEDQVTPEMRRLAKTVNYAVIYGLSEYGLSRETGIPRSEAGAFLKAYNQTYADLTGYMDRTRDEVRAHGYVSTLLGRRRYMPEVYSSSYTVREAAERAAINMPIQGTQADLIKIAMIRLDDRLRAEGLRSRMILQVHDELVLRVPRPELERVAALVRETMSTAMSLDVPVRVDVKAGRNWLDTTLIDAGGLANDSADDSVDLVDPAERGREAVAL